MRNSDSYKAPVVYALRRNEQPVVLAGEGGELRTDSETGLATSGLAQDLSTAAAEDDRLGVREDSGDGEAARALHVHEERVGVLDHALELVAARLLLLRGIHEVNGKRLLRGQHLVPKRRASNIPC